MNILVINQPLNNRGDESAHRGLIRKLLQEHPTAQIKVLFVSNQIDSINQFKVDERVEYLILKPIKGYSRVSIAGLMKSMHFMWHLHPTIRQQIEIYKKADYIICAPGGICMGGFQNKGHLFNIYLAKYLNKPLAYYGRSIGPFPTETPSQQRFKELSLEMLKYFSYLSIRDSVSAKLADSLGIKYITTLDSAFLDAPKVEIPSEIGLRDEKFIVFVPNLLIWHHAYKGKVSKETVISFFKMLLDRLFAKYPTHKILMLPQTFNYGTYTGDDIHFFHDVKQAYGEDERIVILPDTYSSDIQQTIISKAELMVGARYHSVVFALNNNTPFVALSYEHKITGLLQILGKEDCMIDITRVFNSNETMTTAADQFEAMLKTVVSDEAAMRRAKQMTTKSFEIFLSTIKNK